MAALVVVVPFHGVEFIIRVGCTNVLAEAEREEAIGYHCFRGVLSPNTSVYLTQAAPTTQFQAAALAQQLSHKCVLSEQELPYQSGSACIANGTANIMGSVAAPALAVICPPRVELCLVNVVSRAVRPPAPDSVTIFTNDGECFPVKKRMLRSCIALTKAVRDDGLQCPSCQVDVDTLTFDRVLLFLEATIMGKAPPQWSLHHVDDLARDGMVLDVTTWLQEHPGGASIIPRQSLNMDCSRFFELYHASRESFLYLKDFYIGELHPDEKGAVPTGTEMPSVEFLDQLRDFTSFRLPCGQSVVKNHLGSA
eukprot:gene25927-11606_t